ncbi:hypothetical protein [Novosphingobium soli]|uniref:hypothetical protein n=1 Tax=Novosphingobium soli TaxID=574956 RepID=UPI0036D351A7
MNYITVPRYGAMEALLKAASWPWRIAILLWGASVILLMITAAVCGAAFLLLSAFVVGLLGRMALRGELIYRLGRPSSTCPVCHGEEFIGDSDLLAFLPCPVCSGVSEVAA